MAKRRTKTKRRRGLGDILDDRIIRIRAQNTGIKLRTATIRAKAQLCEAGNDEYCTKERPMAKKKKKSTKAKRKSPRKAARKSPARKKARKGARKTSAGRCKVVTVCGKRRRLCFKKKGKRIVIASNTAA